ncbi:MAG TPA: glycosyltransferase family 4 protein [Marmoricola sp.]|nr:glycosyltransferase family 4 protein [Marmoricola sp.]
MQRPGLLQVVGPSKFGGDSVLVLELARAAQDHGFRVDVLATDPRFQELILDEGFGLVDLDVLRREIRPVADLASLARLTQFLRMSRYRIVHTHTSKAGVVGRLAATRAGVPGVMHTVHLFGFHEESGPLATAAYSRIERTAARWCDRIVTVSEYQREWALRLGIGTPEQVVAIPNGVPARRATGVRPRAQVRAELGLAGDEVAVVFTGRLAEQKGLEYLLRAVPLLGPARGHVRVLLAGDGPLRSHLTGLAAELGVDDTVRFLGFRADIGDLLAAADLVVLPSLWEGLSISLLEAMAAGRAVITTDIGSNREVTRDGAVAPLVPVKDPEALAAAMRGLAADPARREELGRLARQEQASRYTMDRMLDSYLEEYDRLLSRAPLAAAVAR